MDITLKKVAYLTISVIGIGWLAYIGSSILMPFIFGIIFALFISPLEKKITKFIPIRWLSILASFLIVILPVALVAMIFSMQFISIIDSLPTIGKQLEDGVKEAVMTMHSAYPKLIPTPDRIKFSNLGSIFGGSFGFLTQGIVSSTNLVVNLFLTTIYTFLLLLYRGSIKNFIFFQFEKSTRPEIKEIITRIKQTVQSYIGGLGLVIIFLSTLNTLGLWIIGIDYPLFWGAFAGILAIIPYIGTALGGLLPFLYSLSTTDDWTQPIAIAIYYMIIQGVEGNLITPKIVGDKININPLFAILALLFFGSLWGVGGIILALPLISIVRIILSHFEETEAVAVLMSSNVNEKKHKFSEIAES